MAKKNILLLALVVLLMNVGCSTSGFMKKGATNSRTAPRQHRTVSSAPDMPLVMNDRVSAWLDYFQGPGRNHFERYLARAGRYQTLMRGILREEGMPQDLIYLSLIESGFNPHAYSRAHAVGAWQFIRPTARRYGMRIDGWLDERKDPIKSTHAAATYLRDLYDEFGDWYLAMAAYNAGEGKVRRVIASSGTDDFWRISSMGRKYFRAETRDYVPKFIAAAMIARHPEKYGFNVTPEAPFAFDTVTVDTQTDLEVVAQCAGTSVEEVANLNPHLIRYATPYHEKRYDLRVPQGTAQTFEVAYADLPEEKRINVVYHRVARGETMAKIAHLYGVSRSTLAQANGLRTASRVSPGIQLVVPIRGIRLASIREPLTPSRKQKDSETTSSSRYRVQKGDTLGRIAAKFNTSNRQLMALNKIKNPRGLRVGAVLKVPSKGGSSESTSSEQTSLSYSIKRGDNLWKIAKKHGVTIAQLKEWNNLTNASKVKPGTALVIKKSKE
ncbi:MAG: LysM peptidoglycan-binding domain-containing protein [Deltaproteobacteria bacterium]|nr:LysM peptidoglycan-binding domain-containing protein [Deltaproteobacteria bacterium]